MLPCPSVAAEDTALRVDATGIAIAHRPACFDAGLLVAQG
jgi:hypothetical protein